MDRACVVVHRAVGQALDDAGHAQHASLAPQRADRLEAVEGDLLGGDIGAARFDRKGLEEIIEGHVDLEVQFAFEIFGDDPQPLPGAKPIAQRSDVDGGAVTAG